MRSLKAAAQLLAAATTLDSLAPLARVIGCGGVPLPLGRETAAGLGLGEWVTAARVATGPGALRALLVDCVHPGGLREGVGALAARLSTRAPHLLWIVLAVDRGHARTAIATWSADRARPRVAALLVEHDHVVDSDAETVCALAAASVSCTPAEDGASAGSAGRPPRAGADPAVDVLTHARWLEILGRDAISKRFYRALERVVGTLAESAEGTASPADRQELGLLYASRLLFLSFLEAKGWLDGDRRFLERGFDACVARGGEYHRRVLRPLFFGTLNTPPRHRAHAARSFGRVPFLNGGLFCRTSVERRCGPLTFPDASLGLLFGDLLARYRFTAREDSTSWTEAAIDPEMLGKAFESLMASRERRASGAFYTPQVVVAEVTRETLGRVLGTRGVSTADANAALRGDAIDPGVGHRLARFIESATVLDPACGSGAFLVHVLEELAALSARLGDPRPVSQIRQDRLTRSIFGVDLNPMAVWLCQLRLWLSVVIESEESDPLAILPLPNLDRHIRVGDSLSGSALEDVPRVAGAARIAKLRQRYARASGPRKRTVERALDQAERAHALAHLDAEISRCAARRLDLLAVCRGRDLFGARRTPTVDERRALASSKVLARQLRARRQYVRNGGALPFSFVTHFSDVAARGGADMIVGNPPWVRLHRIPIAQRSELRGRYEVFRRAAWERGATMASAGAGFAAQVDLAALFVERSLALLRDGGVLGLLLPAKLWRSLAGGGVRRLLLQRTQLLALGDWSNAPAAFDAAVYPSLIVARKGDPSPRGASERSSDIGVSVLLHRHGPPIGWEMPSERLALDEDGGSPWLALPPAVREAFDRLARAGPALAESTLGRPHLGVKCGCNDAFIVHLCGGGDGTAVVTGGGREGRVEYALLRPVLRGEGVTSWTTEHSLECIIWTHGPGGEPLDRLPPHAARWFAPWRRRLTARTDARRTSRWWSLFRTGAADASHARVVWADVSRSPRAMVLPPGDPTVVLNSCYVLACHDPDDADALAALLNSPLAAAWLNALAEPARGGYHRYLAWTVALLPVPRDWARARSILAPLARRARQACPPSDEELLAATARAYRVRSDQMAALLTWCSG